MDELESKPFEMSGLFLCASMGQGCGIKEKLVEYRVCGALLTSSTLLTSTFLLMVDNNFPPRCALSKPVSL